MARLLPLLLLVACGGEIGIRDGGTDTDEVEDLARYDGATLRILEPRSASFLPLGASHGFTAEVVAADGTILDDVEDIAWVSSVDTAWSGTGAAFTSDALDVGLHEITASVELPNGDRLAYTVGGVLVQSELAGTYVGTITTGFTIQGFPVSCGGSATLVVEPYGENLAGTATCLAAVNGFEIPLEYTVEGTIAADEVDGMLQVRIIAFDLDLPAAGTIGNGALEMAFEGDIFGTALTGGLRTERVSRDAGL
jgi:hypothetical protein